MKQVLRIVATASLAMATVYASALTLHFQSSGGFTQSGSTFTGTDTQLNLADSTVTASTFNSLTYSFTKGAGVAVVPGSYTLNDGFGTLNLTNGSINFTLATGLGSPISGPGGRQYTSNQAGIINFSGGTGIFAGLTGTGVLSFNTSASASDPNNGIETTNFDASFEAVPEPASMAVLGVGALGFLANRRRK